MANDSLVGEYLYADLEDYDQWALNVREHPVTWTAIMARGAYLSFKLDPGAGWTRLDRSGPDILSFNVYNVAIDGHLQITQYMKDCFCTMRFDLTTCPTAPWTYGRSVDTYTLDFECPVQPIPNLRSVGK